MNLTNDFLEKKEKYSNELLLKQMKDFSNQIEYKTNLLNIDSQFRNKIPKNIYQSSNITLPNNPIETTIGSDIIKINYLFAICPSH